MSSGKLNMISLNVRGLCDKVKRMSIFNWVKRNKYDVIFLQETHTVAQNEVCWNKEWPGSVFYSHGTSNSKGCAILISPYLDFKVRLVAADRNGRYVILKCTVDDELYTFVNIYAPNNETDQVLLFKQLDEAFENHTVSALDDIVIGGDWNFVRDIAIDKSGGNLVPKIKSVSCLNNLMYSYNLCDVWRIKNPNSKRYTWRQRNPELIQCRLDFWLISESLYDKILPTS